MPAHPNPESLGEDRPTNVIRFVKDLRQAMSHIDNDLEKLTWYQSEARKSMERAENSARTVSARRMDRIKIRLAWIEIVQDSLRCYAIEKFVEPAWEILVRNAPQHLHFLDYVFAQYGQFRQTRWDFSQRQVIITTN